MRKGDYQPSVLSVSIGATSQIELFGDIFFKKTLFLMTANYLDFGCFFVPCFKMRFVYA